MQVIKFVYATEVNHGTESDSKMTTLLSKASYPYSQKNLERAKAEAYNGEVTVEDDGQPEPEPTQAEQLRADVDFLAAMTGVSL